MSAALPTGTPCLLQRHGPDRTVLWWPCRARLSQRGNRQLNRAIHMVAISQIRHKDSEGRAYFERKIAEGKTKKESVRSLKRQESNAVYRQLFLDTR